MRLSHRLLRAREEVKHVNCEARRMHTSIRDEEVLFRAVLNDLKKEGAPLYGAVEDFCRHRRALNARNMAYLEALYSLPGFSGVPKPGARKGAFLPALAKEGLLDDLTASSKLAVQDGDTADAATYEDDVTNEEVTSIIEYLATLTV